METKINNAPDAPVKVVAVNCGATTDTCALDYDVQATAAQYHSFGWRCTFTFEDGDVWIQRGIRLSEGNSFTAHGPLRTPRVIGKRLTAKKAPIKSVEVTVEWAEDVNGGVWGDKEAHRASADFLTPGGTGGGGHP